MVQNLPVSRLSLFALALCIPLSACNAVLGIDAPRDEQPDSERETPHGSSSGVQGGEEPEGPITPPSKSEISPYAWAEWPMPNPSPLSGPGNPQSFDRQARDVVLDQITQLEWQKSAEGVQTRKNAEAYCANLKIAGGDFRLPSRIELLSLIDFTQSNLYLDTEVFPDAPSGKYWSSSRFAKDAASGWLINFEFGTTLTSLAGEREEHLVRCVREKGR